MARAPLITDEPVDRYFGRPVARVLVALVARTPVTPNQLTVLAALWGVATGVALWLHDGWLAAAFIAAYLVFDCADGQLARRRGGGNYFGRAVDGVGDYVTAVATHLGLIAWIASEHGLLVGIGWGAAAGLSMAWSSFLLDRYKRRYRGDVDDVEAMRLEAEASPGLRAWLIHTLLPYSKRLEGNVTVTDRARYQERLRLPMLSWLVNGPTSHFTVLAVFAILERPLLYSILAVGPSTLLALVTLIWQGHLERREPAVVARSS